MKRSPSARKSPPKRRGAKKATTISVRSEKQISAICTRFGLDGPLLTFRDVRAALNHKYGTSLSVGTVWHMGQGHMPKDKETRRALGLVRQRQADTRQIIPGIWAAGGKPVYTDCAVPLMELVAAARRLNFTQRK